MKVIQKILFLSLMISVSKMCPFISMYSILQKDDKQIVLLGDCHAVGKIDMQDQKLLLSHLLASDRFAEPMTFVCEGEEVYCKEEVDKKHEIKTTIPMLGETRIACTQYADLFNTDTLSCVYGDCRSAPLMGFYRDFLSVVSSEPCKDEKELMSPIVGEVSDWLNTEKDVHGLQEFVDAFEKIDTKKKCYGYFHVLVDVYFYLKVQKALEKVDKVVVYAGSGHTEVLKKMFLREEFVELQGREYSGDDVEEHVHTSMFGGSFPEADDDFFTESFLTQGVLKATFGFYVNKEDREDYLCKIGMNESCTGLFCAAGAIMCALGVGALYYAPEISMVLGV